MNFDSWKRKVAWRSTASPAPIRWMSMGDGDHGSRSAARRREPVYARPGRLGPFSSAPTKPGVSMAATPGRLPSPRRGRQAATGRPFAIGNYIDLNEPLEPWGSCTDNWLHRPADDGSGSAPPLPLTPSYCPLSHALHRLEPLRHAGPARLQRPRILPWRPGADVAHGTGRTAAPLHRGGGLEGAPAHLGHGHRRL